MINFLDNLSKSFGEELKDGRIEIVWGDGRKGYEEGGPYDVIHVGAAAAKIPEPLKEQLAVGGIMMIPVGPDGGAQYITICTKDENESIKCKKVLGVRYIPLTSQKNQLSR